jgi:hypothetical protein
VIAKRKPQPDEPKQHHRPCRWLGDGSWNSTWLEQIGQIVCPARIVKASKAEEFFRCQQIGRMRVENMISVSIAFGKRRDNNFLQSM